MATRIERRVIDDLTGEEGAEPYRFALGRMTYEIDLVNDGKALETALAPFIEKARRPLAASGGKTVRLPHGAVASRTATTREDKDHNTEVREWAQGNGIHVAARGRIGQGVFDAYNAVH